MTSDVYVRPRTIAEAHAYLAAHDGAHLLAGGTAFTLLRKQGFMEPGPIVDLAGIAELDAISETADGGIRLGAMTTLRRVETSEAVHRLVPALGVVVSRVATVRIRNQATIGGNIAHADPAQDPPPILLVLDAEVEVAAAAGVRLVPIDGFFVDVFETILGPSEILTAVHIPPVSAASRIGYEKFLPRTADDYATVSVAARLDVDTGGLVADARIALGSVAAVPLRVPGAEAELRGAPVSELPIDAAVEAVLAAVDPMDDVRGSADYKREMAAVWTRRLLRRLAATRAGAVSA
ncbi:MAG: FAD binding domain-containing protein [Candidatus Limnocylindrales bacterium]